MGDGVARAVGRRVAPPLPGCGLQQEQEACVVVADRPGHAQLARAVGAQVGVELLACELRGLLGAGAVGELRVQHPAVAGEPAAGPVHRHGDLVGQRTGDLGQRPAETQVGTRAGRVDDGRAHALADLEPGQQLVAAHSIESTIRRARCWATAGPSR